MSKFVKCIVTSRFTDSRHIPLVLGETYKVVSETDYTITIYTGLGDNVQSHAKSLFTSIED